ncbi:AI-2E family transporter [Bacillus timonensis]|nr:AI-2E family transporter [Bacillus timonensis]
MGNIQLKWLYIIGLVLLLFSAIYIFLRLSEIWSPILAVLTTVLLPFIISCFITYLLHPIIEKLHNKGLPRSLAILFIYIIFFGGIGYGIYRGVPIVLHQLRDLIENLPSFISTYKQWIEQIQLRTSNLPPTFATKIEDVLKGMETTLGTFLDRSISNIKGILNYIILFAIIPFIVFYMLKDYDQMKKAVWYITPRKYRKSGHLFLKDVDESLGNYIRGQLFVCLLIGLMAFIGLWLIKMKYPLLLGVIIGITNVIPYFGPIIGAIPAVILAATISYKMVILVVVIIFGLQFVEGNILSPLIVGRSLHMHPLMIMFSLLLGGEIAGIVGLILAVPVLAVLKVIVVHTKSHFINN